METLPLFNQDEKVYVKCVDGQIRQALIIEIMKRSPHPSREIHGEKADKTYFYYKVVLIKNNAQDNIKAINERLKVEESKIRKNLEDFNS
jgi:hypothetical protein